LPFADQCECRHRRFVQSGRCPYFPRQPPAAGFRLDGAANIIQMDGTATVSASNAEIGRHNAAAFSFNLDQLYLRGTLTVTSEENFLDVRFPIANNPCSVALYISVDLVFSELPPGALF
jgi:hypothetical protein